MRTLLAGLILSALAAPAAADMVPPPAPVVGVTPYGYAQPGAYVQVQPGAYPQVQVGVYAQPGAYVQPGAYAQPAYSYYGSHPIAYDQGGGFCQHGGVHQHPYPVFDEHLFQQVNNTYYFTGDPADFGYGGQTYAYAGAHPIADVHGGGHCYMGWGHRHLYAPVGAGYAWRNNAYIYGGPFARAYYAQRPRYVSYYNGYYRQNYYGGRYYSVRPRHIYVGRPFVPGHHHRGGWRAY
jgi:hypothetical protein